MKTFSSKYRPIFKLSILFSLIFIVYFVIPIALYILYFNQILDIISYLLILIPSYFSIILNCVIFSVIYYKINKRLQIGIPIFGLLLSIIMSIGFIGVSQYYPDHMIIYILLTILLFTINIIMDTIILIFYKIQDDSLYLEI